MSWRFLVTGADGPAGAALIGQLRARGHQVHGADMAPAYRSPYPVHRIPAADHPGFVSALRELVRDEHIDVLVPTVSEELPRLAGAADALRGVQVVIGPVGAVRTADDKLSTALVLHAAQVPVPQFALPSQFAGAAEAVSAWGGPLVVKPRVSRGGRGVELLTGESEREWSTFDDRLVVQEFAPGTEYAPVVYQPLSAEPDGGSCVVLEKVALAQGQVGNALQVRRVQAPDVAAVARAAVAALALTGPVDIDVRRDRTGRPVVLEVNARFGANSAAAPELVEAMLADLAADDRHGLQAARG